MPRKRTKTKLSRSKKQFNNYLPLIVVLVAVSGFFAISDNISPSGDFTVAGKEYSSYVDYYKENPTSVDSDDFDSCIKITKHDARWPKRNYYKVGSKKFKYGSKWRPTKGKTSAMRKAKEYASTEAASDGVDCWKYGKVVGIGKLGCMKVVKNRGLSINVYHPSGKSWKYLGKHQKYGRDWEEAYNLVNSDSIANGNDVACIVDEWGFGELWPEGLHINPDLRTDFPYFKK